MEEENLLLIGEKLWAIYLQAILFRGNSMSQFKVKETLFSCKKKIEFITFNANVEKNVRDKLRVS